MHILYHLDTGKIEQVIAAHPSQIEPAPPGMAYLEHDSFYDPSGYVEDGQPRALPPAPSPWSSFDYAAKQWRDTRTLEQLKEAALLEVEAEREARTSAPIEHTGEMIDADAAARASIATKVSELVSRAELGSGDVHPSLLVWRGADNQNLHFDSSAELLTWLRTLEVAISERATLVRIWSWGVKEQIRAADSAAELGTIMLETKSALT